MEPRSLSLTFSNDDSTDTTNSAVDLSVEINQMNLPGRMECESISCDEEIGRGGSAIVYRGRHNGEQFVAVKSYIKQFDFRQELNCNIALANKYPVNLVKYLGYALSPTQKFLIFEYFPNGSLYKAIQNKNVAPPPWSSLIIIPQDISKAVKFIHESGWLHNDIKPGNVLLAADGHAKLCDFGLACPISEADKYKLRGTFKYMAPEVEETGKSTATDIYSLGVLIRDVKEWNIETVNNATVRTQIKQGKRLSLTENPATLFALIQRMWDPKPEKRPAIEEVISELDSTTTIYRQIT